MSLRNVLMILLLTISVTGCCFLGVGASCQVQNLTPPAEVHKPLPEENHFQNRQKERKWRLMRSWERATLTPTQQTA